MNILYYNRLLKNTLKPLHFVDIKHCVLIYWILFFGHLTLKTFQKGITVIVLQITLQTYLILQKSKN